MTTTTLPRPLAPSMSAPPKPAPSAASPTATSATAGSSGPGAAGAASGPAQSLGRVVAEAALDAVIDNAIDAAIPGKAMAEDTFALGKGLYGAAQIAMRDTGAAGLDVDETQKLELSGKASMKVGAFAEVKGAVAVERQSKGFAVEASLEASAGVGAKLSKAVDGELSGIVGVKVTYQAKDAAAADAKMRDLEWAALKGVAAAGRPTALGGMTGGVAAIASAFDDELLTASSVTTTLGGKASADVSLWQHGAADEAGAALGLDVAANAQIAMTVTNEDGKMRATFEGRWTVSAEASLALQGSDGAADPSMLDLSFNGASEAVSVVQRVSYELVSNFDMNKATDFMAVRSATLGAERTEYAIETTVKLPNDDHQVTAKLAVAGGLDKAMIVAGAALGIDGAVERAQGIKVTGEVERTRVTTTEAKIDVKGAAAVAVASETSKKLEAVKVNDVRGFVNETAKAIVRADVDPTLARINALR